MAVVAPFRLGEGEGGGREGKRAGLRLLVHADGLQFEEGNLKTARGEVGWLGGGGNLCFDLGRHSADVAATTGRNRSCKQRVTRLSGRAGVQ